MWMSEVIAQTVEFYTARLFPAGSWRLQTIETACVNFLLMSDHGVTIDLMFSAVWCTNGYTAPEADISSSLKCQPHRTLQPLATDQKAINYSSNLRHQKKYARFRGIKTQLHALHQLFTDICRKNSIYRFYRKQIHPYFQFRQGSNSHIIRQMTCFHSTQLFYWQPSRNCCLARRVYKW